MDTNSAVKTDKENVAIILETASEAMRAAVEISLNYHKTAGCVDCHMEADITRKAQEIELEFGLTHLLNGGENLAIELLAHLAAFSKFTASAATSFRAPRT